MGGCLWCRTIAPCDIALSFLFVPPPLLVAPLLLLPMLIREVPLQWLLPSWWLSNYRPFELGVPSLHTRGASRRLVIQCQARWAHATLMTLRPTLGHWNAKLPAVRSPVINLIVLGHLLAYPLPFIFNTMTLLRSTPYLAPIVQSWG